MKLTNTKNMKRKSGMTLLELTVVILVLLSLISILFIGARAWKKGSDRAGCLMNIRNMQQAMRGDQNMRNSAPGGDGMVALNIIGPDGYITAIPVCPTDKTTEYTLEEGDTYPDLGTMYGTCVQADVSDHNPITTVAPYNEW
jgi:prepilin-type N-terminal cleavage/methylation domain-containing protein